VSRNCVEGRFDCGSIASKNSYIEAALQANFLPVIAKRLTPPANAAGGLVALVHTQAAGDAGNASPIHFNFLELEWWRWPTVTFLPERLALRG
jgi:hypothetical protein